MNLKLACHRLTNHLFYGKNWVLIIGPDISNRDFGFTFMQGEAPPHPIGEWRQFKYNFRMNIRWPVSFRLRKVS